MTKCQIAGDLPSALSGALKPGQGPRVRIKCKFTHIPWCRDSVGLRACDRLRAGGRRCLVPTKTSQLHNQFSSVYGRSLSQDRTGSHVEAIEAM
jgi:hypothetical protein